MNGDKYFFIYLVIVILFGCVACDDTKTNLVLYLCTYWSMPIIVRHAYISFHSYNANIVLMFLLIKSCFNRTINNVKFIN